jgi:hypothetical protein
MPNIDHWLVDTAKMTCPLDSYYLIFDPRDSGAMGLSMTCPRCRLRIRVPRRPLEAAMKRLGRGKR